MRYKFEYYSTIARTQYIVYSIHSRVQYLRYGNGGLYTELSSLLPVLFNFTSFLNLEMKEGSIHSASGLPGGLRWDQNIWIGEAYSVLDGD